MFGFGGGMPQPTPEQIAALQKQMGGKLPDFPGGAGGLPPPPGLGGKGPALPGLGGPKLPGLPGAGFPFGGKKK
jgi:signal recognition particle subunit SRP54